MAPVRAALALPLFTLSFAACNAVVSARLEEPELTIDAAASAPARDAASTTGGDRPALALDSLPGMDSPRGDAGPGDAPGPDAAAAPAPKGAITFRPAAATFTDSLDITLASNEPGVKIHFTIDGSVPNAASPTYASPIHLTKPTIVRALAIGGQGQTSAVQNRAFLKLEADAAAFTSNVPLVLLHFPMTRPTKKEDKVVAGSVLVFEPDAKNGRTSLLGTPVIDARMGLNIRGRSSATARKKNYKLELWDGAADEDGAQPVLGMPSEADWVLYGAGDYDNDLLIRNAFMYALSNALGRYAPRTRFAEVFMTDGNRAVAAADYLGVYTVTEKIEADKKRVSITKIQPTDNAMPAVTGGYLFAEDEPEPAEMGVSVSSGPKEIWQANCESLGLRGYCAFYTRLAMTWPKDAAMTTAQRKYLGDAVSAFSNDLAAGKYEEHIDVASFIDHHFLNAFSKNPDAFRLSEYFHKDRGGKIVAGPLWDFDRALAAEGRSADPVSWECTSGDCTNLFNFGWYRGLFADAKFKASYVARARELLRGPMKAAALQALAGDLAKELAPEAFGRNAKKWQGREPTGGMAAALAKLNDWMAKRAAWIESCLDRPDPITCK